MAIVNGRPAALRLVDGQSGGYRPAAEEKNDTVEIEVVGSIALFTAARAD